MTGKQPLRTAVFIDGFNLYYGSLKNTEYKWLDLHNLSKHIIGSQYPIAGELSVTYYTAMVKARVATHGEQAVISQQQYHKALKSPHLPKVEIVCSKNTLERDTPMAYVKGQNPDKNDRVEAWKIEEKQTDVRIALDALLAAKSGQYDQIVLMTNDSDLAPLLEKLKDQIPTIVRGLIVPRTNIEARGVASDLLSACNWVRKRISQQELIDNQLRDIVPTNKKPAFKPEYW